MVQLFGKPQVAAVAKVQGINDINTNKPQVLSYQSVSQKPASASFSLTITYIFVAFLVIMLVLDLVFASRINVIRLHGKSAAHIIFLLIVVGGVILFLTRGVILQPMKYLTGTLKKTLKDEAVDYLVLLTACVFFLLILKMYQGERLSSFITLIGFVLFYIIWGVYHHLQDGVLHLKIVIEYVFIGFTILILLTALFSF